MLNAGYKANVIPSVAEAVVDCRVLPGREEAFQRELDEILGPDVEREWITHLPSVETTFDGELVDAMTAAVQAEDPIAKTIPYVLSGGTDAKAFQHARASAASGSPRCGCRRTSTSPRCSTASTSACRSRRCGSGRGCSTASCAAADDTRRKSGS